MSTTDVNPFEAAEAWETNAEQMLPIGAHVVKILEAEDSTTESSGNPTINLKFGNDQGTILAWESYSDTFLKRVVALYDSAGLARPVAGEFDPSDRCRINVQVLQRLVGKEVGIVIRDETDNMNPGKTRRRVAGYLPASRVSGSNSGGNGGPTATPDDDIPF